MSLQLLDIFHLFVRENHWGAAIDLGNHWNCVELLF